jgi:hypothetical protein
MFSDDSLVVKELKERLAKAKAELKEENDATEVAQLKAEVKALIDQIVAQLKLEQEQKEEKEKKALEKVKETEGLNELTEEEKALKEPSFFSSFRAFSFTKHIVGLDGTLHELIAVSQSC